LGKIADKNTRAFHILMSEAIQNVKNNKKLLSFLLFLIRNFTIKAKLSCELYLLFGCYAQKRDKSLN